MLAHSAANATIAVQEGQPELLEPEHAHHAVRTLAGAWVLVALTIAAGTRGLLGTVPLAARGSK